MDFDVSTSFDVTSGPPVARALDPPLIARALPPLLVVAHACVLGGLGRSGRHVLLSPFGIRACVAIVPNRTVQRQRRPQRKRFCRPREECKRGINVLVGERVATEASVAIVRPALA